MLSKTEILRYQKHLFLPEIGQIGQEKLNAAKVLDKTADVTYYSNLVEKVKEAFLKACV